MIYFFSIIIHIYFLSKLQNTVHLPAKRFPPYISQGGRHCLLVKKWYDSSGNGSLKNSYPSPATTVSTTRIKNNLSFSLFPE